MIYLNGEGFDADLTQSFVWMSLAISNGVDAEVGTQLRGLRDEIAARMTPNEVAEARQRIVGWKPEEASSNLSLQITTDRIVSYY